MPYKRNYTMSKHPEGGGFGEKVKNVASFVGTLKSIYDTGKTIYSTAQAVAPYVETVAGFI